MWPSTSKLPALKPATRMMAMWLGCWTAVPAKSLLVFWAAKSGRHNVGTQLFRVSISVAWWCLRAPVACACVQVSHSKGRPPLLKGWTTIYDRLVKGNQACSQFPFQTNPYYHRLACGYVVSWPILGFRLVKGMESTGVWEGTVRLKTSQRTFFPAFPERDPCRTGRTSRIARFWGFPLRQTHISKDPTGQRQ